MGKLDVILLLLAGLQIHVGDVFGSQTPTAQENISPVSIRVFGAQYSYLNVFTDSSGETDICFSYDTQSLRNACLKIHSAYSFNWEITKQSISAPALEYELRGWSRVYSEDQVQTINTVFNQFFISPLSVTQLVMNGLSEIDVQLGTGALPTRQDHFQIKLEQQNATTPAYMTVKVLPSYPYGDVTMSGEDMSLPLGEWHLEANKTNEAIMLQGCTDLEGFLIGSQAIKVDQQTCVRSACSSSLSFSTTECGKDLVCNRDSSCVRPPVCTVTASSVIDFNGRSKHIPNRCKYILVNSTFSLLAGFRERRRQDVSFLDHLELSISGDTIVLDQGGRALVNGQRVTLNATATMHGDVELSSTKTGITANLPDNVTIFFDGNTAFVTGAFTGNEEGLCGQPFNQFDNPSLSSWKSESSDSSCETKHSDPSGAVNCTVTAESCNLLSEEPFTTCHHIIGSYQFLSACQRTLCEYPAVDGLMCQFLEAYAKACSLKDPEIELGDWRSKANCPASPQALCQDQYCTADEFCGDNNGQASCLCRAIFAAKYKSSKTFGDAAVCTDNSATVALTGCLLNEQGIDYSLLHLNDSTCKGEMDDDTHIVTFSFDTSSDCGAEVTMNNSQVIFKNTIMTGNTSKEGVITRHDQVAIDFSCTYNKPTMPNSVSFKIKDSSVVQKIESGNWSYTLMMNAYTDSGLSDVISETTELMLNQKIWVELKTEGLDDTRVAIVTDSCWATNVQSHDAELRYDLIKNKCPDDKTVKLEGNGNGISNSFSFNMFEFAGKNSDVYLHCKLELCLKNGNSCVPTCNGNGRRKRSSFRSKFADKNPAVITMAWTK